MAPLSVFKQGEDLFLNPKKQRKSRSALPRPLGGSSRPEDGKALLFAAQGGLRMISGFCSTVISTYFKIMSCGLYVGCVMLVGTLAVSHGLKHTNRH